MLFASESVVKKKKNQSWACGVLRLDFCCVCVTRLCTRGRRIGLHGVLVLVITDGLSRARRFGEGLFVKFLQRIQDILRMESAILLPAADGQ